MTCRIYDLYDYGIENGSNNEQVLGPILSSSIFKNKHFLLTCPVLLNRVRSNHFINNNHSNGVDKAAESRLHNFSSAPFVIEHLTKQLKSSGGVVYSHFEDIPKTKYKGCILIAPEPCVTARYVQSLAVNISAVSHEFVIECCRQNRLLDLAPYLLPSGWSILDEKYVRAGRFFDSRNSYPLMNRTVLISSENEDFIKFWTRVCKFAGAKIRPIKSVMEISASKRSFLLTDSELSQINIEKAKAVNIPIVSTVWVVQCLILGKLCAPDAHENLTRINFDLCL